MQMRKRNLPVVSEYENLDKPGSGCSILVVLKELRLGREGTVLEEDGATEYRRHFCL